MKLVEIVGSVFSYLSLFLMVAWGVLSSLRFFNKKIEEIEQDILEKN